jgi:gluconokinase
VTRVVVMGVSGCGKSTVGVLVADRLGVPFLDADSLHPPANLAKMAAGVPLDDEDRWPWLRLVGAALAASGDGTVVACSALRRPYRDLLRGFAPDMRLVHLHGTRDELAARMSERHDHFMPVALLETQLAALEPLGADETAIEVDCALDLAKLVDTAVAGVLAGQPAGCSRPS